jgi:2-iminobutanoate/2-iminopropanoate deaminase
MRNDTMTAQTSAASRKALVADLGPLSLLLGMGPQDLDDPAKLLPESVELQAEKIFRNAERVLADAGLKRSDIVGVRVHLVNFERVHERFLRKFAQWAGSATLPAHSIVGVAALTRGAQVEMDFYVRRGA